MASRLSDDELRQSLREFGEDVGPVTPTTRAAYERRLTALRRAPLNALSSDDSEIESPPSSSRKKRTTRHPPHENDVFKKPAAVNVPIRRPVASRKSKKNSRHSTFEVETSDSDASETPRLIRRPLASFPSPPEHPFRSPFDTPTNSHRYPPTLHILKKAGASPPPPSNGFLPPSPSPSDGEGSAKSGCSTEYSHCISWLLLVGTVAFFLLIGLLYVSELHKNTPTSTHNPKFCDDIPEDQCKPLLLVSRELHYLLTQVAGAYECGHSSTRNMSEAGARAAMRDLLSADDNFQMVQFDEIFNYSLSLFQKNPSWGVKCLEGGGVLEAEQGAKSLWCRTRLSLHLTLARVLVAAAVVCACGGGWACVGLWRRRREAQEKLFYEMVEQVIDVLREPPPGGDPQMANCRPVVNVRDALIPPHHRRGGSRMWLWERVVRFIEENESRVSVEYRKIQGEDYKVWRWNTPHTQGEGGKQGKVWQGQAFSSPPAGKSPFHPTPCLKIRNMFDPEVEVEEGWQEGVRDALLEKCEGNDGIVHIAFDTSVPNNEGCVYVMCKSTEAAGKAYSDLHGWWFDGKLVTVKYLKRSRYLERFPSAPTSPSPPPLRPSNDRRSSLAHPFHSSALERS